MGDAIARLRALHDAFPPGFCCEPGSPCDRRLMLERIAALEAENERLRAVTDALEHYIAVETTSPFVGMEEVRRRWQAVKDAVAALARSAKGAPP